MIWYNNHLEPSKNLNSGEALSHFSSDSNKSYIIFKGTLTKSVKIKLANMCPWSTKPVIRVNFEKLRFMHHVEAE